MRERLRIGLPWLVAALALVGGCGGDGTPGMKDGGGDDAGCTDRCTAGDRLCTPDGYQQCEDIDSDGCLEWSPSRECGPDQRCEDGECVTGACDDECAAGSVRCSPGDPGVESCEMDPTGACLVWSEPEDCPDGQTCSGGACMDPEDCSDECAEGSAQCAEGGVQTCEDGDADPCMEWSAVEDCPDGQTCSEGTCSEKCTNECAEGTAKCATGSDAVRSCGDFDGDACLEWGAAETCPDGQTCSSGECSSTCEDECSTGDTQCDVGRNGVEECGDYDSDDCLDWGPTVDCDSGATCRTASSGDAMCVDSCYCDYNPGVCEPESDPSTTACSCDPDCDGGASPCVDDGHCDTWCPEGEDPDCATTGATRSLHQAAYVDGTSYYEFGHMSLLEVPITDAPADTDFSRWAMLHDGDYYRLYLFKEGTNDTLYQFAYDSSAEEYVYGYESIDEVSITGIPSHADTSTFAMLHDGTDFRLYFLASSGETRLVQFVFNSSTEAYEYAGSGDEVPITGAPSDTDWSRWAMLHDGEHYRLYTGKEGTTDRLYQFGFNTGDFEYQFSYVSIGALTLEDIPADSDRRSFAMLHDGSNYRFYFQSTP